MNGCFRLLGWVYVKFGEVLGDLEVKAKEIMKEKGKPRSVVVVDKVVVVVVVARCQGGAGLEVTGKSLGEVRQLCGASVIG